MNHSDGGKGSKSRPFSVSNEEYAKRWDAIFGKDDDPEEIDDDDDGEHEELTEEENEMTTKDEALKMALYTLKHRTGGSDEVQRDWDAIRAIEEALAQPAVAEQHEQSTECSEPVALLNALEAAREWIGATSHGENCFLHDEGEYNQCFCGKDSIENYIDKVLENTTPYVAEPRPERKPLSLEVVDTIHDQYGRVMHRDATLRIARALEAAHGIKE